MDTLQDLIERLGGYGAAECMVRFGVEGQVCLKYDELARQARDVSAGLAGAGLERGARVAISARVGPETLIVAVGVLYAGGVLVPLDTQMGDEGLAHVLRDSTPALIFADREGAERMEKLRALPGADILLLDAPWERRYWRKVLKQGEGGCGGEPGREDDAVLFYTSGTTGRPKGVPLTHANLVYQLGVIAGSGVASGEDRLMLALPMHHVYPFVMGLLAPLAMGACIIVPSALTGQHIMRAVREGRVTVIIGVPRLYRALREGIEARIARNIGAVRYWLRLCERLAWWAHGRGWRGLAALLMRPLRRRIAPWLRLMASGGSALEPELAAWLETMGWQVAVGYGLTETSPLLSLRLPGDGPGSSVGRPVEGTRTRIEKAENREGAAGQMREADGQEQGEIHARGPGVFRGYRNMPEETGGCFTDDGWFRTGDLGRLDRRGYLYVGGRLSTMIVTEGGENVPPEEAIGRIETVRDLLREVADSSERRTERVDPVSDPDSVLGSEHRRWLPPRSVAEEFLLSVVYGLGSGLVRLFYRIEVLGLEQLEFEGACVIAPNHTSYLDPFVLGVALGRKRLGGTCWAGLTGAAFDTSLKRFGSRLALAVPIDPRRGAMSSLGFAAYVLKHGYRLVWFPEGGRSHDGSLQRFKPGLGAVLSRLPVPVIPVLIEGAYDAWPPRRKYPRPGRIRITFGQARDVESLQRGGDGRDDSERIVNGLRRDLLDMKRR